MPMFTIVGGVNGAGKSSLSGVLKDCLDDLGVIVDPDKITAQLGGDEYAGGQAAVARLQDCLAQGIDFTEESTLSGSFLPQNGARGPRRRVHGAAVLCGAGHRRGIHPAHRQPRCARAGTTLPARTWSAALPGGSGTLASCCRCATRPRSTTTDNGFRVVAFYRNGELLPATDTPPAWLATAAAGVGAVTGSGRQHGYYKKDRNLALETAL